jgi:uncharacterized protein YpuA (DUF1002 family)
MDITAKVSEIIEKIKNDKDFGAKFTQNPIQAVESVLGVDLPDEQIKGLVESVKAKLNMDKAGGILGSVNKLF